MGRNPDAKLPSLVGARCQSGFRLVEKLSEGGQAVVYRARHPSLPGDRAVKVPALTQEQLRGTSCLRDLRRVWMECELMKKVDCRFIIKSFAGGVLRDAPDGGEHFYHEMEYGGPWTLVDLLERNGGLGNAQAFAVLEQAAAALGAFHDAGIVHRDIKPQNILIQEVPRFGYLAKLADLGMAKVRHRRLTAAGRVVGTPGFIPPEAASGYPPDPSADVFGLCVTAYLCLTLRFPFPLQLDLRTQPPPPPIATLRPSYREVVPRAVEKLILRGLARSARQRPSMGELREAFCAAAGRDGACPVCEETKHAQRVGAAAWSRRDTPVTARHAVVA